MKSILALIPVLCIAFAIAGCVQEQTKATETAIVHVNGIQCNMCVEKIEKAVGKLDGVQSVSVNLDEKQATVQYVPAKLNVAQIESGIAYAGYDANDTRRNEEAYQKLPACCQ